MMETFNSFCAIPDANGGPRVQLAVFKTHKPETMWGTCPPARKVHIIDYISFEASDKLNAPRASDIFHFL